MKNLRELFNGVTGIVGSTGDLNLDPDTKWFDDLNNRRELYRDNPNAFAYYSPKTDTPSFPITDRNGKPNIKMMLRSLAQALCIQSQNPTVEGIDDVIHKLEDILVNYREDLTKVPEYRINLVRSKDTTQSLNNLVYGPYDPRTSLAVMVSSLGDDPRTDLGNIKVDVNTNSNDFQHDPPEKMVNQPQANRVNIVQKKAEPTRAQTDMEEFLKDLAIKAAQLKILKMREKERESNF